MNGEAFKHYDDNKFMGKTVFAIDPSTNTSKTIKNDIDFIQQWLSPGKYLQLLPKPTGLIKKPKL